MSETETAVPRKAGDELQNAAEETTVISRVLVITTGLAVLSDIVEVRPSLWGRTVWLDCESTSPEKARIVGKACKSLSALSGRPTQSSRCMLKDDISFPEGFKSPLYSTRLNN